MKTVPRYWGYARTANGMFIWRSSATCRADAETEARKVAERIDECENMQWLVDQPQRGEYPYGVTLREKLLEEINDSQGRLQGFITRNHAGAEVLNVRNVMFLDWDTPIVKEQSGCLFALFAWIGRLFGGKSKTNEESNPDVRMPEPWEEQYPWATVSELKAFMSGVTDRPDWGIRIYKTAAGYRGIATHAPFDPTDPETLRLMERFACDPVYVRLCQRQESFRARITPKGWRCGLWPDKLPRYFQFYYPLCNGFFDHLKKLTKYLLPPDYSADEYRRRREKYRAIQNRFAEMKEAEVDYQEVFSLYQEQYEEAEEIYDRASAPFATCRYLGTVGSEFVHPEVREILNIHDKTTRALSSEDLTLA